MKAEKYNIEDYIKNNSDLKTMTELLMAIEDIQDLLKEIVERYGSSSLIERALNICEEVLNDNE